MTRVLINYDYRFYPTTTASYIEMALRKMKDVEVFRLGENRTPCADIYLNIEPCQYIIKYPGKKSAYYEIDNHIHQGNDYRRYQQVDTLFIAQDYFKPLYVHDNVHWIPLAADPDIHKLYEDEPIKYDIGFLGNDSYPYRRELLEKMSQKYKVLWSGGIHGEDYARKLSQCKMLFNCALDHDVNMRFFEAISIGRLLLTDPLADQDKLFVDGHHYVSYKDWPDLDKKIQYFLNAPDMREMIAKSGREHCHKFHTYMDRTVKMLDIIQTH